MERRRLGTFGPSVSVLGLGCMNLSGNYGPTSEADAMALLARAVELGIDHLDTADIYGIGQNEELIGQFLRTSRARVKIATKVGIRFVRITGERYIDNTPAYIRQAVENSLSRLGRDHIDLLYVHRREVGRPIEELMEAMARLKQEGKVGAIGLSEVSAETIRQAHACYPVNAVQNEYSIWTRVPERGVLDATRQLGIALVAFSPVARGLLTGSPPDPASMAPRDFRRSNPRFLPENYVRNREVADKLATVAAELGRTPAGLALAWLIARSRHIVAIPGTRSIAHLEDNVRGVAVPLGLEETKRVEAILPDGFPWGARYSAVQALGVEEV
ncbi:MAG: aldo/keto reductase [Hyphomicrobiaceae bacterium]|nr:aldo/keto reductase [Hyphomicrobiaceae bacterium]